MLITPIMALWSAQCALGQASPCCLWVGSAALAAEPTRFCSESGKPPVTSQGADRGSAVQRHGGPVGPEGCGSTRPGWFGNCAELERLAALHSSGGLDDEEEFRAAKARIIGS